MPSVQGKPWVNLWANLNAPEAPKPTKGKGYAWGTAAAVTAIAVAILAVSGIGACVLGGKVLYAVSLYSPLGLLQFSAGALMLSAGLPQLVSIVINSWKYSRYHLQGAAEAKQSATAKDSKI